LSRNAIGAHTKTLRGQQTGPWPHFGHACLRPYFIHTRYGIRMDPQHSGTTCASVPTQDDPWWRVDLMSIYHITAVSVFSEQHCCQEQLDGAEIRIGLRNDTNNHRCAIISAAEGHTEYGYQCGVVLGRFVYVVLPGQQRNLTVCEVQVYAVHGKYNFSTLHLCQIC
uniref:Fucolectin tachylectin-4 pentraxin-1 domain-containing protein n=1 Tax=Nothobranchius furzeri TaxID=105023 RepID=A0A8C6KV46_NOTFU